MREGMKYGGAVQLLSGNLQLFGKQSSQTQHHAIRTETSDNEDTFLYSPYGGGRVCNHILCSFTGCTAKRTESPVCFFIFYKDPVAALSFLFLFFFLPTSDIWYFLLWLCRLSVKYCGSTVLLTFFPSKNILCISVIWVRITHTDVSAFRQSNKHVINAAYWINAIKTSTSQFVETFQSRWNAEAHFVLSEPPSCDVTKSKMAIPVRAKLKHLLRVTRKINYPKRFFCAEVRTENKVHTSV